jgi:hypothetical protein
VNLERAWALGLLAVPAILLWSRLREARPRAAEASSLLLWRKVAPGETPAARPRPPLAAWMEAAGAALLAIGLADPGTAAAGAVRVVVDVSPSMGTRRADGGTRREAAEAAVPPGNGGEGPVVLLTDHRGALLPGGRQPVATVGLGDRAVNAGITAAAGVPLPDGRWRILLTVEVHGVAGPVEGTLTLGRESRRFTVVPGTPLPLEWDAHLDPWNPREARVILAGDACGADDAVVLRPRGTLLVWLRASSHAIGSGTSPLFRALEAAAGHGIRGPGDPADVGETLEITVEDGPAPMSSLPPFRTAVRILLPDGAGGGPIPGAAVVATAHALVKDVRIDPSVELGTAAAMALAGEPLLVGPDGPLLTAWNEEGVTHVGFRFAPGGTWAATDPSFVVLAQNFVDHARGGPARLEATGVLDPAETREAAGGETFGDLAEALRAAAAAAAGPRRSLAPHLLGAGAALLLAAWWSGRR